MERRELLAGVSGGALAGAAGCLGDVLAPDCNPGDTALGQLTEDVWNGADPGTVQIRGVVVEVGVDMVLHDGTGWAELSPPYGKQFSNDWFDRGDCVEATGRVAADYTREHGIPDISISSGENVETTGFGDAKGPTPEVPSEPDTFFNVTYDSDGAVTLVSEGPESVPAGELEVRHLTDDGGSLSTYWWHELTGLTHDEPVAEGDELRFDEVGDGHLLWRPTERWAEPISSGWAVE